MIIIIGIIMYLMIACAAANVVLVFSILRVRECASMSEVGAARELEFQGVEEEYGRTRDLARKI